MAKRVSKRPEHVTSDEWQAWKSMAAYFGPGDVKRTEEEVRALIRPRFSVGEMRRRLEPPGWRN